MESVVEFSAVIHRALGSVTSIRGEWEGKEREEAKAKRTRENVASNGCCLSYMGS